MYFSAVALAVVVIVNVGILGGFFGESDLMVTSLEVLRTGDELSVVHITFRNEGSGRRKAGYSVVFSADPVIGAVRDFLVYSDDIRIGWNRELTVELGGPTEIQEFVDGNDVRIPRGYYSLGIVIDPRTRPLEHSEFNDFLTDSNRFFYGGAAGVEVFEVEIKYSGILPLDDVPRCDNDGTGYFMLIIHDPGDNLQDPYYIDPGDVAGLYKEVTDNLVYGGFAYADGSPMFPGQRYTIDFSLPPLPEPDIHEMDDWDVFGTIIDYAHLPVRQYHTFHDEGSGDMDREWFRIFLQAGDSLTVETLSADGLWEIDTGIDLNASQMNYIRSNHDKTWETTLSELTYVNDTGVGQVFHIVVNPHDQYRFGVHKIGEYIVEFGY